MFLKKNKGWGKTSIIRKNAPSGYPVEKWPTPKTNHDNSISLSTWGLKIYPKGKALEKVCTRLTNINKD